MNLVLRPGTPADAERCGAVCFDAFGAIAARHGYPHDFPSIEIAMAFVATLLSNPHVYSVVAECDGRIVGSNFLDERAVVSAVGPITVDPEVQDGAVGRRLMEHVLARASERRAAGVRLVQAAYHCRSLSLYTKLGFRVRESLVNLHGEPPGIEIPGHSVRAANAGDLAECNRLCRRVHGLDRDRELREAVEAGTATVVESDGRITGYATALAFFAHAVAESNADLKALISAAAVYPNGFLLPARNAEVFAWALDHGLRVVQVMTLMSIGLYSEPCGAWLPSVGF